MKALYLIAALLTAVTTHAQVLKIEENVLPDLERMLERSNEATDNKDWKTTALYNDSTRFTLIDKTVSGGYLEDRDGKVWNMGVLDMPYVLVTVHHKMLGIIESLNRVADDFENEAMVFLMIARPEGEGEAEQLKGVGKNLIVVFEDDVRDLKSTRTDTRIIGLLGYPITHYVRADRTIALVEMGQMTDQEEAYKRARKNVKNLLKGRLKMKWRN